MCNIRKTITVERERGVAIKRFIFIFIQPKVFYSGVTRHGKPINNVLTTLLTRVRASLNKKIKIKHGNKLSYSNVKWTYTMKNNIIVTIVVVTKGEPFNRYIKHNMAFCCTRPPVLNVRLVIFWGKLHTYIFFHSCYTRRNCDRKIIYLYYYKTRDAMR